MGWKAHATGHGLSSPWVCPAAQKKAAHPCAAQRRNRLLFRYVPSA
jgi:hypothetical protein